MKSKEILACLLIGIFLPFMLPAAALAQGAWPMTGHDPRLSQFNPDEQTIGAGNVPRMRRIWSIPRVTIAIARIDRIYAVTRAGSSYRLGIFDRRGKPVYAFSMARIGLPRDAVPRALAFGNGKILMAATSNKGPALVAINPVSQRVAWRSRIGATGLIVAGQQIYTSLSCSQGTTTCGRIASYGLDLRNGRVLWTHSGNLGRVPALIHGRLYQTWGLRSAETRVYLPGSGTLVGKLSLNADWTGSPFTTLCQVRPATGKWWLGRVNASGKTLWRVELGRVQGGDRPALAYGTLFASSNRPNAGVVAVATSGGRIRWRKPLGPDLSLSVANHVLFVLHRDTGFVDALKTGTGRRLAHFLVPGFFSGSQGQLIIAGETVYVLDGSRLIAMRPKGVS